LEVIHPGGFPADRDEYVRRYGNERTLRLLRNKIFGRLQRMMPLWALRLMFLKKLGATVGTDPPPWISVDIYIDDTFPELVTIESGVMIGPRCMFLCHDDKTRIVAPVTLRARAFIGAGAILLPGVTVGPDATVGAGAVVTRSIPAGEVWAGVPARRLRESKSEAA
jgi:acetyltransferase-like isoleucine patch superfamily enzyme